MVRTIEVPEEIDRSLALRAEREGTSVESLAAEILRKSVVEEPRAMTPAEIMDRWQREGLVGWRSDVGDSASLAREIREKAQHRER